MNDIPQLLRMHTASTRATKNRAKNGFTSHTVLCYKALALIRVSKKQEEEVYLSQKEGDILINYSHAFLL